MKQVEVKLSRHYAWVTEADDDIYEALWNSWSFSAPGAFYAPSHKLWLANKIQARADGDPDRKVAGWDGKIRLMYADTGKLPAGLFRATKSEIEKSLGIKFKVTYDRPSLEGMYQLGFSETNPKYIRQNECVDSMLGAIYRGGGVVISATGTGKTATTSQLFSKIACSALFVVDTIDLLYQAQKEVESRLGEKVGIVGNSEFTPERITIGTIQTLQKHCNKAHFRKWYSTIKVLVIDELHKALAKRNFKLLEQIRPIATFGLTATLQMKKKDVRYRVYSFCGPVLFKFPVKEAMEKGVVSTGRVIQLLFPALDEESRDAAEAYREETLEHPTKLEAARLIVNTLVDQGRYVMVLADRVAHVQEMDKMLYDIAHAVAYGDVKKEKRKSDRDLFEMGDIRCLIANRVYEKGISLRRVDIGIDLAELPSQNDCVQKFGRLTRLHNDKHGFIYIDFGTFGLSRRSKAARMRASAFRREGLNVKIYKLDVPLNNQAKLVLDIITKELQSEHKARA